MKSVKFILFLVLLLLMVWGIALAAEDIDTQTSIIILTIPATSQLAISNGDVFESLSTDGNSESSFDQGYYDCDTTDILTVNANKAWELKVKVSTDWAVVGSYQKDTRDLKVKATSTAGHQTGFTDFTSLSLTDQQIATYTAGVSGEEYICYLRIMLDWAKDIPGTYQITLTYTISTSP